MELSRVQRLVAEALEDVEDADARFKLRTALQLLDAAEVNDERTRAAGAERAEPR